jgi:hypothetical protein
VTAVEQPPDDPDAWSEEQWIEWLNATNNDGSEPDGRVYAPRLSSPAGTVLGAAMFGLEKGMYGEVDKPEIVIEVGSKGEDGPKVDLDPDDPSASTVVVDAPAHD